MTLNGNLPKINKLKFREKKLVVATHNNGKLNEIKDLLKDFNCKVYSSIGLNLPVPKENGSTFEDNALIKTPLEGPHPDITSPHNLFDKWSRVPI